MWDRPTHEATGAPVMLLHHGSLLITREEFQVPEQRNVLFYNEENELIRETLEPRLLTCILLTKSKTNIEKIGKPVHINAVFLHEVWLPMNKTTAIPEAAAILALAVNMPRILASDISEM